MFSTLADIILGYFEVVYYLEKICDRNIRIFTALDFLQTVHIVLRLKLTISFKINFFFFNELTQY